MRTTVWMSLVLVLALLAGGVAEAKGGKGGGRGNAKVKADKFTSAEVYSDGVSVRSRASARSSFPPGNAWGLRRNRGEPVPLGAPTRRSGFPLAPVDGQQIFRAGRAWEFDARDNRWELLP
jgi:hypothetical protein